MLETLRGLPPGTAGLRAVGKVSREDYSQVFEPLLDEARREDRGLRFLYQFGPDFEGFTLGATWQDAKLGLRFMRSFEGCAIVSDISWVRKSSRLVGFLLPCPVRVFKNEQLHEASEWLQGLPARAFASHRLLTAPGVNIVEIDQALRVQDFDALANTADAWIREHGELQGMVIHARNFPGWDTFGSLSRHLRFVRDHHRKIGRIALAADSHLMNLAPSVGEHFVQPEIKSFGYDALDAAVSWAGTRPERRPETIPTRESSAESTA